MEKLHSKKWTFNWSNRMVL